MAASIIPNLHDYLTVVNESVAGWSSADSLDRVDGFCENKAFVSLMHQVVGRWAHVERAVLMQARTVGSGWVHVCDERSLPSSNRYQPILLCVCIII
jgi:hypothetical protein